MSYVVPVFTTESKSWVALSPLAEGVTVTRQSEGGEGGGGGEGGTGGGEGGNGGTGGGEGGDGGLGGGDSVSSDFLHQKPDHSAHSVSLEGCFSLHTWPSDRW